MLQNFLDLQTIINMSKLKTAVVTGSTSGFGKAISEMLLSEGYKVYGLARREDRLKKMEHKYINFNGYKVDVRSEKEIHNFFNSIKTIKINLLVNSAGLALNSTTYDRMTLEEIDTMIDTNIFGLVHMTHHFLKCPGSNKYIINIGSIAGNYAYPNNNIYGSTKAFVNHFSHNLRSDFVNKNIRVTSIEPGLAKTEFSLVRLKDKGVANSIYNKTQYIKPKDIALLVKNLINLPKHLNVNSIEIMPITQACGPLLIHRST